MPPVDVYAEDLALLLDNARAAGEIAKRHHRTDVASWEKADGAGPVTEADIAIDRMLKAELTAARPDHGWLSEEIEDDRSRIETRRVFIVDPIDGTRAFMRGDDDFCHALAIADAGEIIVAVAHFPIKEQSGPEIGVVFLRGGKIMATLAGPVDDVFWGTVGK